MAIGLDWGQYVLWHLGPQMKVSYDGRCQTVYPDWVRKLNDNWIMGVGRWDALLDDYPTDWALVNKRLPGCNLMRLKPGWTPVYEDSMWVLFGRRDLAGLKEVRNAPPPLLPVQRPRQMLSLGLKTQDLRPFLCRNHSRQPGKVLDRRQKLPTDIGRHKLADSLVDHRTDLHQQMSPGVQTLGRLGSRRSMTSVPRGPANSASRGSNFLISAASCSNSATLT